MDEHHELNLRWICTPADILTKLADGVIKAADVPLLMVVDALVVDGVGCYASNEYLAQKTGRGVTQTREAISRLKALGLIKQVGFDGTRRYLETAWSRVGLDEKKPKKRGGDGARVPESRHAKDPQGCRDSGRQHAGIPAPERVLLRKTKMSAPKTGADLGGGDGFGMAVTANTKNTIFDINTATTLLEASRKHLGVSHPITAKAKISSWATHIRKLRELDMVDEGSIVRVLKWYTKHMGDEYAFKAYSGESFRKKFHLIKEKCDGDFTSEITISPTTERICTRLNMLGWPKGAGVAVPGATEASLEGYNRWVECFKAFKATQGPKQQKPMQRFIEQVDRLLQAPGQFTYDWMLAVHDKVSRWDDWSGDFAPYVFKPTAKRFMSMGRAWAESYNGDPDTWDRLVKCMETEGF